jgi:hypothetical protein
MIQTKAKTSGVTVQVVEHVCDKAQGPEFKFQHSPKQRTPLVSMNSNLKPLPLC